MGEVPMGSRDDVLAGGGTGGTTSSPMAFPIPVEELGTVSIVPNGSFEAGSYQTFVLTYVAGKFGIDDSGSMRVCFRFASDQTRPQFDYISFVNITYARNVINHECMIHSGIIG